MKKINVLSLFDGISCGQIALERAGIKYDKYYSSEIDKHAINVTQQHYPDTIQLGDIKGWKKWKKKINFKKIDIIFAGFPCQAWSIAGKMKGDKDPRGALVYDLIKVWKYIRKKNPKVKFLFENVKMKNEYIEFMNNLFGVEPIIINSALVSAQNRVRLYWTNIRGINQPKNKNIMFKDILGYSRSTRYPKGEQPRVESRIRCNGKSNTLTTGNGCGSFSSKNIIINNLDHTKKALDYMNRKMKSGGFRWEFGYIHSLENDKSQCLTANIHKGVPYNVLVDKKPNQSLPKVLNENSIFRKLHPIECERLQTLPEGYTGQLSNTQRYKTIGNGWTVDVIAHILKNIKKKKRKKLIKRY